MDSCAGFQEVLGAVRVRENNNYLLLFTRWASVLSLPGLSNGGWSLGCLRKERHPSYITPPTPSHPWQPTRMDRTKLFQELVAQHEQHRGVTARHNPLGHVGSSTTTAGAFTRAAAEVSRDLHSTAAKVQQLTKSV